MNLSLTQAQSPDPSAIAYPIANTHDCVVIQKQLGGKIVHEFIYYYHLSLETLNGDSKQVTNNIMMCLLTCKVFLCHCYQKWQKCDNLFNTVYHHVNYSSSMLVKTQASHERISSGLCLWVFYTEYIGKKTFKIITQLFILRV